MAVEVAGVAFEEELAVTLCFGCGFDFFAWADL
jgi:hypothetical protein